MSGPVPKAVNKAIPCILGVLPPSPPGLSTRQIHAMLGDAPFCASSLGLGLDRLERDGAITSQLGIGKRRKVTRFYWRAGQSR